MTDECLTSPRTTFKYRFCFFILFWMDQSLRESSSLASPHQSQQTISPGRLMTSATVNFTYIKSAKIRCFERCELSSLAWLKKFEVTDAWLDVSESICSRSTLPMDYILCNQRVKNAAFWDREENLRVSEVLLDKREELRFGKSASNLVFRTLAQETQD